MDQNVTGKYYHSQEIYEEAGRKDFFIKILALCLSGEEIHPSATTNLSRIATKALFPGRDKTNEIKATFNVLPAQGYAALC